jgi:hypothetical protein
MAKILSNGERQWPWKGSCLLVAPGEPATRTHTALNGWAGDGQYAREIANRADLFRAPPTGLAADPGRPQCRDRQLADVRRGGGWPAETAQPI